MQQRVVAREKNMAQKPIRAVGEDFVRNYDSVTAGLRVKYEALLRQGNIDGANMIKELLDRRTSGIEALKATSRG